MGRPPCVGGPSPSRVRGRTRREESPRTDPTSLPCRRPSRHLPLLPAAAKARRGFGGASHADLRRLAAIRSPAMTLRVVQWTTGNVGRRAARAIVEQPSLELVGCYAFSPAK